MLFKIATPGLTIKRPFPCQTGARKSALHRTNWKDADFQGNRLRLKTRKTAGGAWKPDSPNDLRASRVDAPVAGEQAA